MSVLYLHKKNLILMIYKESFRTDSRVQPLRCCFGSTAAEAWARVHPSRPGSLLGPQSFGADMNGAAAHMRHDSRLHQVLPAPPQSTDLALCHQAMSVQVGTGLINTPNMSPQA